jgi:hypothetical protein
MSPKIKVDQILAMKRKTTTIGCIVFFFVLAVGGAVAQNENDKPTIALNPGPAISESEFPALEREALAGGADAALKLRAYYVLSHVNREREMYWTAIAAENGSPSGQYSLGVNLIRSADQKEKLRGIFWLRKAEAGGEELAREVLKEIGASEK